jgi:hypothetical protein
MGASGGEKLKSIEFFFLFLQATKPEESDELQDEQEEDDDDEEEDIYADSESLLGQLISSAMPNSRGAAPSRLPRSRAPARAPPPLPQLNESGGGGSDDSCCSADNADILEACIASAMPSKPGKTSAAVSLTEQSGKLPQQQRFNLGKESRAVSQCFGPASFLSGSWSRSQFLLNANGSKLLCESGYGEEHCLTFNVYEMSLKRNPPLTEICLDLIEILSANLDARIRYRECGSGRNTLYKNKKMLFLKRAVYFQNPWAVDISIQSKLNLHCCSVFRTKACSRRCPGPLRAAGPAKSSGQSLRQQTCSAGRHCRGKVIAARQPATAARQPATAARQPATAATGTTRLPPVSPLCGGGGSGHR